MGERFRVGVMAQTGVYKQYALHDRSRLREVGLYVGSDPSSDIPIDEAEAWHAHLMERNGALHIDVIAGDVRFGVRSLTDGETARIDSGSAIQIAGAMIAIDIDRKDDIPDHIIIRRTDEPQALFYASRILRVRVVRGSVREVLELRPFLEPVTPVSIGSDPECDVIVDGIGRGTVRLAKGNWQRIGVARDVVVQLCRWPRRDEEIQVRWERPPPPAAPEPPRPPPPPIDLGATIDEHTCLAALLACISARPPRPQPPRAIAHAVDAYELAPSLHRLFTQWATHHVGRVEIGELVIGDRFLEKSLPMMIKGELYGEVDIDYSSDRTDILVIGRHQHRHVALRRMSMIEDSPIQIDVGAGTEIVGKSLGSIVCDAVRFAHGRGIATELDTFFVRSP